MRASKIATGAECVRTFLDSASGAVLASPWATLTTPAAGFTASNKGIKVTGKGTHTVKAKAAENGYIDSAVATATFTIH